jgi:Fe-S cluster assembly ATP-binding protein
MKLKIRNLHVNIGGKEILKGINLELENGKVYAIMGPNGSGKSTLANVLSGNSKYEVVKGEINLDGNDVLNMKVDERAKAGIFMSFQYPQEISGVTIFNFLRTAYMNLHGKSSLIEFRKMLKEKMDEIGLDESYLLRYLNEGFSGGEKKKSEILQMLVLNPSIAILDETDSGLDIDALRIVAKGVKKFSNKDKIVLVITHYRRLLDLLDVDRVFIMKDGKIVKDGGKEIVDMIEESGYKGLK